MILILVLGSPLICPVPCFAWHDDDGWHYYGSGRDEPYSYYVDQYYSPGPRDYTYAEDPDFMSHINHITHQYKFTVNVPNTHGGFTAVIIKRSGNGFTGPQGEFYTTFPKVSQLKVMYGK